MIPGPAQHGRVLFSRDRSALFAQAGALRNMPSARFETRRQKKIGRQIAMAQKKTGMARMPRFAAS